MTDYITRCTRNAKSMGFALSLKTPRLTRGCFFQISHVVLPFFFGHVGVDFPAKSLPSIWSRQQEQDSPGLPAPMLASTFRQSLCLPSGDANKNGIPQGFRRPCWRRLPGKAFAFRLVTPTRTGFPRVSGAHVGVDLCLPSGHANKLRISRGFRRRCWRRPPGKAFAFRLVTPTRTGFPGAFGVHVGVDLPAKPLPSVWSRQQEEALPV